MQTLLSLLLLVPALPILCFANQELLAQTAYSACDLACTELSQTYPSATFHGLDAKQALWSLFQAEVSPRCTFYPLSASDVALALSVSRKHACHFAVLGGGTSPFRGAANAEDGITIDLFSLQKVDFAEEQDEIRVGGGSTWADVYKFLEPKGFSAAGTRNSLTGVAGSILGGGISFFSQAHGWSCDTVTSFEIVLANSTILNITYSSHPDLFWALRGGGNNFGIITSLTLEVFPMPTPWYIYRRWDISVIEPVFQFLVDTAAKMPNEILMIATTLAWFPPLQQYVVGERLVTSSILELPDSWPVSKSIDSNNGTSEVQESHADRRNPLWMSQKMDSMNREGYYNYFGSVTVKSNVRVFMAIANVFKEEVEHIKGVEGLQVYIVYNPLTVETIGKMTQRGGNALGLETGDGTLSVINTNLHWSSAQDTPRLQHFMRQLSTRFRHAAQDLGSDHRYIFQNHAFEEEDVFPGYGKANLRRLRSIRRSVDPDGVFQRLLPGFFKLGMEEDETGREHTDGTTGKTEL